MKFSAWESTGSDATARVAWIADDRRQVREIDVMGFEKIGDTLGGEGSQTSVQVAEDENGRSGRVVSEEDTWP